MQNLGDSIGKFNVLKEHSTDNEVIGERYTEDYSNFVDNKDKLTVIKGFPSCPICGHMLARNWIAGKWICNECSTIWASEELIEAIESERAMVYLSVRNLTD